MEEEIKKDPTDMVKVEADTEAMNQLLFYGDISALSQEDKGKYLFALCKSQGLNPWTRPFDFITLNGKLTVYANKGAAAQLADVRQISSEVVYEGPLRIGDKLNEGIYQVSMKFTDSKSRVSFETGAVTIQGLQGEALSNAIMKCWTKCKRRGTLSHAGLGFPDEAELDSIPEVRARQGTPRIIQPALNPAELSDPMVEAPSVTVSTPAPPRAPAQPQTIKPALNGAPPRVIPAAKPPIKRV